MGHGNKAGNFPRLGALERRRHTRKLQDDTEYSNRLLKQRDGLVQNATLKVFSRGEILETKGQERAPSLRKLKTYQPPLGC